MRDCMIKYLGIKSILCKNPLGQDGQDGQEETTSSLSIYLTSVNYPGPACSFSTVTSVFSLQTLWELIS